MLEVFKQGTEMEKAVLLGDQLGSGGKKDVKREETGKLISG